ncbi:MAG: type II toxin-antitoxin system RelE/ParE family toxin [Synechococcaceae cyanobacterium SM2_3_1]|nr:type II toxin-antitoxin system RelE/ParE family toxin [Synechococcaceae cyanobacterium SM2_3_1]
MKSYDVSLTPDAVQDLMDIYLWIAEKSGLPEVALSYIESLRRQCQTLETAPYRGRLREDIRPDLRIVPLADNAVAAFQIDETAQSVLILNIFYGGRDYETLMGSDDT